MYRALPVARQAAGRGSVRVVRRRLATEAAPQAPTKKPRIFRRIVLTTTFLTGTFYVGSAFVALNNQPYYDFFSEHVPLGQATLEFAEEHNWDTVTLTSVIEDSSRAFNSAKKFIEDTIDGKSSSSSKEAVEHIKERAEKAVRDAKVTASHAYEQSKARFQHVAEEIKTDIHKAEDAITGKAGALANHQVEQLSEEILLLKNKAEDALAGRYPPEIVTSTSPPVPSSSSSSEPHVYDRPLPVGFEPPPGYVRPAPPKKRPPPPVKEKAPEVVLPLITPEIESLSGSEPIISHLAGTIDNLTSYLKSNPEAASRVTPVIESAKKDLADLVARIDKVRNDERAGLESKLDEQTREYTIKLLELEMEAQDKLDSQEEDFRKFFDHEKMRILQAYREKLDNELRTQTELINERLKEEVIAQGIELQRRWIREVRVHVEQERGGRLAKIDELSTQLKKLERIALDNSLYLDENIRVHALWSAIRAVTSSALSSPERKPFREELRTLRHIATAREDNVVATTLDILESSDTPDIGVEPLADLSSWFTTSVAPKVSTVALVPEQNAGLLSHLASYLLSSFTFKRHGLVEGDDVLSVLARAEYHLNEKDLDSATRELNQLKGTAAVLLEDWLNAARRRLEVEQALDVVQTQATLASLLVV